MRDQATGLSALLGKLACSFLALGIVASMGVPVLAQLEITEIMYNPTDEDEWEWIEVRNTGATDVDLDGWLGFNMNDTELAAPNPTILSNPNSPNTVIKAGEVAVIYDGFHGTGLPGTFDDTQFRAAWNLDVSVPLMAASFWPSLSNTEESVGQSVGFWANQTDYMADISPVEDVNNPGTFINRITSFANTQFSISYADASFPAADGMSSMTWTGQGDRNDGTNWVLSQAGVAGGVTSVEVLANTPSNSTNDIGNPGVVTSNGTAPTAGIMITEIMYDSGANPEAAWEWIEIHNPTGAAIDLAGWVVDDNNGSSHEEGANIAAGSVPAGGVAILYNADDTPEADFETAWGAGLNLIAVEDWSAMQLNNGGDTIGLWSSFANYDGDHQNHANAELSLVYTDDPDFPNNNNGGSITLNNLGADVTDGISWDLSFDGDSHGSANASPVGDSSIFHPGEDIGSPGVFVEQSGADDVDLDDDGDVDGADFLAIQRTNPSLIPAWESQYGDVAGLSGVSAVPEPTSLMLFGLAAVMLPMVRRQRA